jgi:membrane fusion protein (multidrug efflux system)
MNEFKGLLTALLLLLLLSSCGNSQNAQQQQAPPAVPVNAHTVTKERVTGLDTYPGTVVPLNEVELRPQVAGYITNIYVQDGQKVAKGQKLYEIDRSKYQAGLQQAQASVRSAKANLERVRKDVERYERLLEKEAIARQQVDYARADLQTAQAQVATAQAQLTSASTDLGYSVITAPFSGTVGISKVRVGAQVSPGQPLLNTISTDDPIAIDFVINEQEIPRFNRMLQGPQSDSLFTIRLANGTVYPHPAKLVTIDRAVGRQTGTIIVRLNVPNPNRELIAGMTVNINVLNQDVGQQLVIPYKAVTEQLGEYFAFVIQGDSVLQQRLQLGTRIKEMVVVREGLQEGDRIVVEGVQRLRPGAKVQVGEAQPVSKL